MADTESQFMEKIHQEILSRQGQILRLMIAKGAFISAIFAVGAGFAGKGKSVAILLYFAPIAGLVTDFFTIGLQYSVKRMGAFLRDRSPAPIERDYESFIRYREVDEGWRKNWIKHTDTGIFWLSSGVFTILSFLGAGLFILQIRPEVEALLSNGASQRYIAGRYNVTEATLSRWIKQHKLKKPKTS